MIGKSEITGIHLHISGGVAATLMPWWVQWLRTNSDSLIINCSISAGALRFVTEEGLRSLCNGSVWSDSWDSPDLPGSWMDGESPGATGFLVAPASLNTVMKLSAGETSTPAMMMLQMTKRPIVLADTIPGGNEIIEENIERLSRRHNVHWAPRVEGFRAVDRSAKMTGFNIPGAFDMLSNFIKGL